MLVLDHSTNNPVLAVFTHELSASHRFWRARAVMHSGNRDERVLTKRERRRLVIRNKWWLIVTLKHNPMLIGERKHNVRARLVSKSSNWPVRGLSLIERAALHSHGLDSHSRVAMGWILIPAYCSAHS